MATGRIGFDLGVEGGLEESGDRPANPTANLLKATAAAIDPVIWNDWYVVARSVDLPIGAVGRSRLLDTGIVLWRSADGAVQAWRDRCPHRSVQLSKGRVAGDRLVCPYHGLAFDPTGRCVLVPAHPGYTPPPQSHAETYAVQERYGLVYVCLGVPGQEIVDFPEWHEPGYRGLIAGPYTIHTSGPRAIENFLDVTHLPILHADILGSPQRPEIADYEVQVTPTGIEARNLRIWQPDPYGTGSGSEVVYDYRVERPLTAHLRKPNPSGANLALLYHVTPVSETECVGWMAMALNFGQEIPDAELIAFQDRIVQQDLDNLESHNPPQLPLNPAVEFHLPGDRMSLAYRKWLRQLGVQYGVMA
ncbi:aromatic ring-hydroxylating dioxygenase subunit alpha [Thermoleptolyngbya sichuanensis XZ-Cy5]|uniref:aromatic ring-hydroxylating dioxygenase subunit alpha n=1 Tax=Thermoleptolyngbya sichuanensis TaxID=2885951 RepID=UPI00240E7445|nr:aromatic ring-hydroxylating dioxygenase subunit alpha [Thermoleptolyngbya sichuanensis XZ-Cy5]